MADARAWPNPVSKKTRKAGARIAGLKATDSVCPYCAVGCAQKVFVKDEKGQVTHVIFRSMDGREIKAMKIK